MCLFIIYCGIVLALLWIMHILCFVKQYDVTRHFSFTSNLLTKITQRKFNVHVICIWILVYVQILIKSNPDWKVGYRIINPTASPSTPHSGSVWHIRYLKLSLGLCIKSYILTPYALKTPINFEVKCQGNKFLHSFLLIYTSKHFIF